MNCEFCQRPCTKGSSGNNKYWDCNQHNGVKVRYVVVGGFGDQYWLRTEVIARYQNDIYRATFFQAPRLVNYQVSKEIFLLEKTTNVPREKVLSLEFHPEITPDNIKTKLPTLLTFS